jgi:GNAT superfamily N-acetyltransferase
MIHVHDDYELDDDAGRVDRDAVWTFLSTEAYWGRSRTRSDVDAQFAAAWRVVGAYERAGGGMVGFARAVSDGVAFAYLADVFVLPEARGRGLGKELVRTMIDRGPGAGFRWSLHTADAHGLYRHFGFAAPDETYLERPRRTSEGSRELTASDLNG